MFRIPSATYRLQFNAQFTFQDARRIVAYLSELGISDIYASPLLRPRKGSTHGYDIVDATSLNPELGSDDDFTDLNDRLEAHGMGLMLDIVPNHMAASHENAWWMSVLENGPQSRFLHYFDIDWRPVLTHSRIEDKVLLPILGGPYGETLEKKEIQLGFDVDGFHFSYYDKRFPLAPQSYAIVLRECLPLLAAEGVGAELRELVQNESVIANSRFLKETLWRLHEQSEAFREALAATIETFNGVQGDQASFNALDALLDAQWYRLAYWRIASETINYRRFFDVTDLVGLRVENPEVFEMRNRRILDFIAEGKVTSIRIDHIDGLYDPVNYLTKLQARFGDPEATGVEKLYVVVEKILEHGEALPSSFACAGTTGYDFLDTVNALMIDPQGLAQLDGFYRRAVGFEGSWEDVVYARKKQAIDQLFSGEMRAMATHLGALAEADRNARDFSSGDLLAALIEVTACMPVYRTYVRDGEQGEADRKAIGQAIAQARRRAEGFVDQRLFDFLQLVLLLEPPSYIDERRSEWLDFVLHWQQFTGRVMAKGVDDTAFYNYNRLLSLNEVGGEPGRRGEFDPVAELHERNERMARDWPHTMNATSTHDTKRSEDVRARLNVLSEIPEEWGREVRRWMRINAALRVGEGPSLNEELMIYQTLLGMWPLDEDELGEVPTRLRNYLEKALREAKTRSSWLKPDETYESDVKEFATALLRHEPFLGPFRRLQRRVAFHGFLNSLAQVVVKCCSPGIPDFYQGNELWDFSLVDPDNRRPVDYEKRIAMLEKPATISQMLRQWQDGRIKQFVTARCLAIRKRRRELFLDGNYRAIETGTPYAVAFGRGEGAGSERGKGVGYERGKGGGYEREEGGGYEREESGAVAVDGRAMEVIVVVPRLTTNLTRAPKLPLGGIWGDAAIPIEGQWTNVFTGETIGTDRTSAAPHEGIPLSQILATFPVAILERA